MHIMADLSKEKFNLHLNQCSVELYGLPCFSAKSEASLLYTTVATVPIIPPVAKKASSPGRRNPILLPAHTHYIPSSSLTYSSDSTLNLLGWNFDSKVQVG